jgi:hypothetical protein
VSIRLLDIFPATAVITTEDFPVPVSELRSAPPTKDAAQLNTARVIVTNNRIVIARDAGSGPMVAFSEEIDSSQLVKTKEHGVDHYVTTVTGKKIAFKKDTSCGCGSRLRSWNPNRAL